MRELNHQLARIQQPKDQEFVPKRPYLPFMAALKSDIIEPEKFKEPYELEVPVGVVLAAGYVPRQNDAGLIVAGGEVWAVDHASVFEVGVGAITLGPSEKDDVSKATGKIGGQGLTTMTNTEGRLCFGAMTLDRRRYPFAERGQRISTLAGHIAIEQFDLPGHFEVSDTFPDGRVVVRATPRLF